MLPRRLSFLQRLLLGLGIGLFRLLAWTIRVKLTPHAEEFVKTNPTGHLFFLWHNRLALALIAFSKKGRGIPLTGLVSASGDGAILAEIMQSFGVRVARGSSSRRAVQATRELIDALEGKRNIVITPDGPRGPCYSVKEGAATIGADHARGTVILGLAAARFWQMNSWDRFILPKPFSTITVDIEPVEVPDREKIQAGLTKLNG